MVLLMCKLLSKWIIRYTIKPNSLYRHNPIQTVLIKILLQMNVN